MSKKNLPTALATFATLGGINTLLTVSILVIINPLLTNPILEAT
jgi:putative flippase GtrA